MIIAYQRFKGSILITSLFLLMLVFLIFFNAKDELISQQKYIQNNDINYLKSRLSLSKHLEQVECPFEISDFSENIQQLNYNYHCAKNGLFRKKPPTKKHIKTDDINQHIDISQVKIYIDDLSLLPDSSINNPKVVVLNREVTGKLDKDFYGIIITSYPFTLGLGSKFYGTLYSPFEIDKNTSRYITFNKSVIAKMIADYTHYLPNSKNLINAEK